MSLKGKVLSEEYRDTPHFDGHCYIPQRDDNRLHDQLNDIRELMLDGKKRSVEQIRLETGNKYPEASIQAQLRNLRKKKFGGYDLPRAYIDGVSYYWIASTQAHDSRGQIFSPLLLGT